MDQAARWKGPIGKRNRGRPFTRWTDDIIKTAGPGWMEAAQNRGQWASLEEAFTHKRIKIRFQHLLSNGLKRVDEMEKMLYLKNNDAVNIDDNDTDVDDEKGRETTQIANPVADDEFGTRKRTNDITIDRAVEQRA
ncbi:hypothetical protein ACJJTC_017797 [Scirpophaga incertulas]